MPRYADGLLSILISSLIFARLLLLLLQVMAYDFSNNGWTLSSSSALPVKR